MSTAPGEGEPARTALRVTFTQSGGFAGLVRGCTLDGSGMEPHSRAELDRLVAESGLDGSTGGLTPGARDREQYSIEIARGGDRSCLVCDDATLPASARPLVEFLAARARPVTPR